ncbi:putative K(+)-stimulated pyrophosphate-energized sodium pump [Deltaproteobacteria bacterium]|nr:putative K(+)-stimulated pyrophosphate-energized sodium pump [Deltaproteobacteria bacterium]
MFGAGSAPFSLHGRAERGRKAPQLRAAPWPDCLPGKRSMNGPLGSWLYLPAAAGVLSLVIAAFFYFRVRALPEGNATMSRIAGYIREGSMAFLSREYKVLAVYAAVVFVALGLMITWVAGLWFLAGAALSLGAGFIGMKAATYGNVRTAQAAATGSKANALLTALDGGAVMGLCVAGLALIGLFAVYFVNPMGVGDGAAAVAANATLGSSLHAFAVGASSIALFARIGGGIYTKAADVGADIAGKVIENIPEDDPRNPGVIADNVGDNVGDVAGMGADIYESLVAAVVATMAIGLTAPSGVIAQLVEGGDRAREVAVGLPLVLSGVGLVVSVAGIFVARAMRNSAPSTVLRAAMVLPPVVMVGLTAVILPMFHVKMAVTIALAAGAIGGAAIGLITEYYTGSYAPVKAVAESAKTGAGTNVIRGMAVGMESVGVCLLLVVGVAIVANNAMGELGLYGIALAAVGMLSGTAIVMTVDAYGPISDNAGGIAEMAGLPPAVREITDELDAVGNTTAAIGKGFAIGSATLTVVALFSAYSLEVNHARLVEFGEGHSMNLALDNPQILIGLLVGAVMPFAVAASTMLAVGKAAGAIVIEIKRQFDEIKGLREGTAEPEPSKIVDIATSAALSQMILPGLVAVLGPVLVGFTMGPAALAGTLAGALAVGASMSLFMANAGGAWDNAKKYIEKGGLGDGHRKRSETHKAAVVGDTVGDPFKDTSGPGVAILIKVMSVVSLLIAPLVATVGS